MRIIEVQPNPTDPKARMAIVGILQPTTGAEATDYGIKQGVRCDGVAATFWGGKTEYGGKALQADEIGREINLMCNAKMYNGAVQYSLSRPRSGGGKRGFRDNTKERQCRNRGIALSYALNKEMLGLPYSLRAFEKALVFYEFMENGTIPLFNQNIPDPDPSIQEPSTGDNIPF